MKTNTKGTIDLSEKAIQHLKSLDIALANKVIQLDKTVVTGFIDLLKTTEIKENLSIYDIEGRKAGCYLPFYLEIDNQIVLLNLDHMINCTLNINEV